MIEGPAGIGKTALLGAARAMAEQAQMQILVAHGREFEQEFAHGVTRQLLDRVLSGADPNENAALMGGAAKLACLCSIRPQRKRARSGRRTWGTCASRACMACTG
jgi:hypothetical protein